MCITTMHIFKATATENAVMQAHSTNVLMPHVLAALRTHPTESDIQAKGLVALGVMAQVRVVCCLFVSAACLLVLSISPNLRIPCSCVSP